MTQRNALQRFRHEWLRGVMSDPELSDTAKIAGFWFFDRADADTLECYPSYWRLALDMGNKHRSTAIRATAALEARGWLKKGARGGGRARSNLYGLQNRNGSTSATVSDPPIAAAGNGSSGATVSAAAGSTRATETVARMQPQTVAPVRPRTSSSEHIQVTASESDADADASLVVESFKQERLRCWPADRLRTATRVLQRQARAWLDMGLAPRDLAEHFQQRMPAMRAQGVGPPHVIDAFRLSLGSLIDQIGGPRLPRLSSELNLEVPK